MVKVIWSTLHKTVIDYYMLSEWIENSVPTYWLLSEEAGNYEHKKMVLWRIIIKRNSDKPCHASGKYNFK